MNGGLRSPRAAARHLSTVQIQFAVWALLLVLLAATIGASFMSLGPFSPVASFGIAIAKAALVFWFYMHLKEEGGLVRIVALGAAAWLLILFGLSASDLATRDWW